MSTINVAYIIAIDAPDTTVDRVVGWLHEKKISVDLLCTQVFVAHTRLIIVCELEYCAIGITARRLRKVQGITDLQCLIPKQFKFRSTPATVLQLIHLNK